VTEDEELGVSIECEDTRHPRRTVKVARFVLLQDVEPTDDVERGYISYRPPAQTPGPNTEWFHDVTGTPDNGPGIATYLLDDRPVSIREANRWPRDSGRVRVVYNLACRLCPQRVELAPARLFAALDWLATRGESRATLRKLDAIVATQVRARP